MVVFSLAAREIKPSRLLFSRGELPPSAQREDPELLIYMYIYIYICICVCMCICVYIYIYTYIHTFHLGSLPTAPQIITCYVKWAYMHTYIYV